MSAQPHEEKPVARGADWAITKRLLGYMLAHRRLFWISFLLYPLAALTVVAPPYIVRLILDEVIPERDLGRLQLFAALYIGALGVKYVTDFGTQLVMSLLGQRATRSLRTQLFAHVQRLPAAYFDRNPIGRLLTRLTTDVEALGEVFATGAVTIIGDVVSIAAVVAMMFWLDVKLTLFSFLVVPPLVALTLVFRVYARRAFRTIRLQLARMNTFLGEHMAGMAVVQLFRQQERTAREFSELNVAYRDANKSAILFDALLYAIVEAIGTIAVAAMIWWGAVDLTTGAVGAGTLVAFIQYISRFFVPVRDLSTKYTILQSGYAAAERVFQLLDEPVPILTRPNARPIRGLARGLELRDVWFSYREPERDEDWTLRGINLGVARGEKVALVGATGSGKTTLLKLLNRSYEAQRGSVLADGADVRDLELESLRRLFAVVLQDVYLFTGSIMENLGFADGVTPEAVHRAARAVQAHDFIERLPRGYDTPVKELGVNFSAGERQLLAFARALARDPELLILDEATSNVDSETEARIQHALDVLLAGRTAIVVAHRLATVRKVDRIIVLSRGEIVEQGSHEELLAKGGVYGKLVELQFGLAGAAGRTST